MKGRRYYQTAKPNYSKLFSNKEDEARMAYNRDMEFRDFVLNWDKDNPELLAWSLADFYDVYKNKQMVLGFLRQN